MLESLIIFAVAMAGGMLPLLVRLTDRWLHSALALATGIFLGAVFLHMLPSLPMSETGADGHGHDHGTMLIWMFVLGGVLAVYFLEGLVFRSHDHDDVHRHRAVGYASLAGLSLHSLTGGLALGTLMQTEEAVVRGAAFLAIVAHKGFETFSLATVFQLAQFGRRRILWVMTLFALVTPVGVYLGHALSGHIDPQYTGFLTAVAAGTFLYVCLCELLPELFHHMEDSVIKIGLLITGITIMVLVAEGGG